MRIALLTDIYKPSTNGVVHHVAMLKQCLEALGETVWLFVPSSKEYDDDEPNLIRIPGIPLADTGYHLSLSLPRRAHELLRKMDILHVHHPFVSGSFGLYAANRYNIPLVFTITRATIFMSNNISSYFQRPFQTRRSKPIFTPLARAAMHWSRPVRAWRRLCRAG